MVKAFNLLKKCSAGVASIEFAIVAPMILLIIMGTFELGIIFFMSVVLEGALDKISRMGMTTYSANSEAFDVDADSIVYGMIHEIGGLGRNSLFNNGTFGMAFTCTTGEIEDYSFGDAGAITCYQARYEYRFATPFLSELIADPFVIKAITVRRNEARL